MQDFGVLASEREDIFKPVRISANGEYAMHKILIIDNDAAVCESLSVFFSEEGYDVTTAGNAVQGLNQFLAERIDLVILNSRLPDFDGFSVMKDLRKCNRDVKVIMVSTYRDMSTMVKAMALGAVRCVGKPIDVGELRHAVEEALE